MFVVNYILLFDLYGHGIFVFIVLSLYVHCMFLIQLLAAIRNELLMKLMPSICLQLVQNPVVGNEFGQ